MGAGEHSDWANAKRVYSGYSSDRGLGFAHPLHQRLRFAGLVRHVDCSASSVLDYGCGFAELYPSLVEAGAVPAAYHGVDLLEASEACAAERLSEYLAGKAAEYKVRIGGALDDAYDVVCCFAVLSVDEGPETEQLWRRTLEDLWLRTRRSLVFDLRRIEKDFAVAEGHRALASTTIAEWAAELSTNHVIDNSLADHFSLVVLHRAPTSSRSFWDARSR